MTILDNLHNGYRIVDDSLIQKKVDLSYEQMQLLWQKDQCKREKMHIVESLHSGMAKI